MVKVLGIQTVDYTSKKTNNHVVGSRLHCSHPANNIQGLAVEQYYVSNACEDLKDVKVGDEVDFNYNRYGNIVSIIKASK